MSNPTDYPEVLTPCRRSFSNQLNSQSSLEQPGQKCDGKKAYRLTPIGSSNVMMKCAKCGHTWTTPIGGTVNI